MNSVILISSDLMLSVRVVDTIEYARAQAVLIDDNADTAAALDLVDTSLPVLILVDLAFGGDWDTIIRRCKLRPHTRHIPIYAFGSHVDSDTLSAARHAGADHVWARSRMMKDLAHTIDRYVNPPTRYLEGWDDELSELARKGIEEFNKGEYFEQHELLEEAWMAEERPIREMYQGILQVGVAFYHIEQGNWAGSLKLFRRGLPKLRALPEVCQGVQIGELRRDAERLYAQILALGRDGLGQFDTKIFPKVLYEQ